MSSTKMHRILAVDDQKIFIKAFETLLRKQGYDFISASNGEDGIIKAGKYTPDLILLDLMMPGMDGREVCRRLKKDPKTWSIPIIMLTSSEERSERLAALEAGVSDFLNKPFDNEELLLRTRNLLKLKEYEDFLKEYHARLDEQVQKRTAQLVKANKELIESKLALKNGYIDTVHKLTRIAEYKDQETAAHIRRVGHLCSCLAGSMGWDNDAVETIFYASPMHDIGKVAIPSDILLKPGPLKPEEFALMKTHTTVGGSILKNSKALILQMAEWIAYNHHERWDGSGYPEGRSGEDIPLEAAIMNLVDQYDALRSERPYKPSLTHEKVFRIITEGDGRTLPSHFNPRLLEVFKDTHEEFNKTYVANS
ncbi:MAG: HD domain-containing phosphohydrolase [Deltaproteobacteria bacterium]